MSLFLTVNIFQTVLIVDFEHENVCWVHIEKKITFEEKMEYIMRYIVAF